MSTAPLRLSFQFNGETHNKRTNDIGAALDAVRPPLLLTEMYVTVKKGKHVIERKLNLIDGRKLFSDSLSREIFINNLMLERYV
jgi:hypothetical protein